jgi:hypothetical protein
VHGAEQVEPAELREAVELPEVGRGIQALLEVAAVDEVVELGGVLEEADDVLRRLADLAGLLGHLAGSGSRSTTVPSSKKLRQCGRTGRMLT